VVTSPESLNAALSAAGHPWQAAENPISRLPRAQQRYRLGVPLPDEAERAAIALRQERVLTIHQRPRPASATAPAGFDARDVSGGNYVTDIRDQGQCGSCVAFGSVCVLETTAAFTRRQASMALNLSEAHLFYSHGKSVGATCDTGWLPLPALGMARDIGITFEDYFPYTAGNTGGATLNGDWPNRLARAVDVVDLTGNPDRMKEHISTYGAITACFVVYEDFFAYRSGTYKHVTGTEQGGHCVALVGYDDAKRCWIAKNSWGTGWGEGGFFRIGYGECEIEAWQCVGVTGVRLRAWTGTARVLGLWSDAADRNSWTYLENYGWHRLANTSDQVQSTMLTQATAAKVAGRHVNAFADNGVVNSFYVL
jgi:C1A family cysteine protease